MRSEENLTQAVVRFDEAMPTTGAFTTGYEMDRESEIFRDDNHEIDRLIDLYFRDDETQINGR